MAVRNDGIQALLAAEKAAGELVAEAKRRRAAKLAAARAEAIQEVEIERKEREKGYKIREDEVLGCLPTIEAQIASATQKTLAMQAESTKRNKDSTIRMLLDKVLAIDPRVHVNYRAPQTAK